MFRDFWASTAYRGWMGIDASAQGFVHPAPRVAGFDEGELLLGELNCLACHSAPAAITARLNSRGAPKLGAEGLQRTPPWLQRWLQNSSATKPRTAMPRLLPGRPIGQRQEAAESLTHFLVSIAPTKPPVPVRADPAQAAAGKALYHSAGSVACHVLMERAADSFDEAFQRALAKSVPLRDLGRKYLAGDLVRFLLDPVHNRPGGRKPAPQMRLRTRGPSGWWSGRNRAAGAG